jgi:hypothetical protein
MVAFSQPAQAGFVIPGAVSTAGILDSVSKYLVILDHVFYNHPGSLLPPYLNNRIAFFFPQKTIRSNE